MFYDFHFHHFFELSEDAEPTAGELDATVLPPLGIRQ